ncbi:MAG: phage terminase large subunit [Bacteroidales bacterium]|nr:phage terminase large subunit [Bacteroidales bacterium]
MAVEYRKLIPALVKRGEVTALRDAFDLCRGLEKKGSAKVIGGGEHGMDSTHFDTANFEAAHRLVKEIRKAANELVRTGINVPEALDLYYRTHLFDAPYNFDSFCLYIEKDREPKKRFYLPRRKQLKVLADAIQDFEDDKLDILGISMPPGVGKSTIAEFGLAWTVGRNPFLPNLIGSHNNSFLAGMYSEMLRIFDARGEYRWGDVFPGLRVIATNAKDMQIGIGYEKTDDMRFRTLSFSSIGSGNAGKVRAMNWLYVDDLVQGIEQALSRERMDKLWQVYYTDLQQRMLGEKARQLVIGTRWSVADPLGRLEVQNEGNDRALFINLPVADADDHSLFNYPYGLGYSDDDIKRLRDTWDEVSLNAIYFGKPVEREGLLYEPSELNRYFELPDKEPDSILAICDTKEQGSDYCACPVFYQYGSDFYLDGMIFDNGKVEVIEERLARFLLDRKVRMCRIESNRGGTIFAQNVQKRLKEMGGMTSITTKWTQSNKETRIQTSSSIIKRHVWFKDESLYSKDREYRDAMRQLCSYSMVGRNKHDDFADVLSLFVDWQMSDRHNVATILKRPF